MFKAMLSSLLGVAAVVLLLGAIGFVAFYFTRSDVTVELVPIDNFPIRDSLDDGDAQSLTIVTLLPKDAIPAILEPEFATMLAIETRLRDSEMVIGVDIMGDARAYPIYTLSRHEIVNDVVGGEPIAVTW